MVGLEGLSSNQSRALNKLDQGSDPLEKVVGDSLSDLYSPSGGWHERAYSINWAETNGVIMELSENIIAAVQLQSQTYLNHPAAATRYHPAE
jgi:hypothetical protein